MAGASFGPDQRRTGRHAEAEVAGPERALGVEPLEGDVRALAEAVQNLEHRQLAAAKADAHRLQRRVGALGQRLHPAQAVGVGGVAQAEGLLQGAQVGPGGQQGGRGLAQHLALRPRRDLGQIGVVEPQGLAIGDDELLKRPLVMKAKAVRALKLEHPVADLHPRGRGGGGRQGVGSGRRARAGHGLGEGAAALLGLLQKGLQIAQGGAGGGGGGGRAAGRWGCRNSNGQGGQGRQRGPCGHGASQAGERKGVSVHGTHFDAKPAQRLQTAAAQV